jgi:hypothetical protein
MSNAPTDLPPAGWYPDSNNPGQKKWWDGTKWTEHVQDASSDDAALSVRPAVPQPLLTETTAAGYHTAVATDQVHPVFVSVQQNPKRSNGFGVAALVIGIVALVGSAIPFVNYVTGPLAFVALALGIVGIVLKNRPKAAAIAGTIIAAVALLISIILASAYTAGFNAVVHSVQTDNSNAAKSITLVYTVTGDSTDSSITYATYADGNSGSEQANDAALPFTKSYTVKQGGNFDFKSYSVFATNGQTGTTITCSITLDGKVVSTKTSTGQFASADCSYSK